MLCYKLLIFGFSNVVRIGESCGIMGLTTDALIEAHTLKRQIRKFTHMHPEFSFCIQHSDSSSYQFSKVVAHIIVQTNAALMAIAFFDKIRHVVIHIFIH